MSVITIPKEKFKNDDLVIIPRTEYSNLLELKKIIPIVNATKKEVMAIRRGKKEIERGEYLTSKQLKDALGL